MNRCFLIGNLTKDPELRTTGSGLSVCSFSIGVSRRYANYLRKGSQVGIIGTIQNRSYEAKDGSKRYITEIVADEVQFIGKNNNQGNNNTAPAGMQEIEEDMPF